MFVILIASVKLYLLVMLNKIVEKYIIRWWFVSAYINAPNTWLSVCVCWEVKIKSESRDSTLDVYSVEAATFSISGHRAAVYIVHLPIQQLSRNASSVSFGHAEHCFLTVWTPKIL